MDVRTNVRISQTIPCLSTILKPAMTLSLTCRGCGTVLSAETEDELVAQGQEHAAEHGHTGPPPREHVLREFAATTLGSGSATKDWWVGCHLGCQNSSS
jgi:hypothetical protein